MNKATSLGNYIEVLTQIHQATSYLVWNTVLQNHEFIDKIA
jgi:hypothetical protein